MTTFIRLLDVPVDDKAAALKAAVTGAARCSSALPKPLQRCRVARLRDCRSRKETHRLGRAGMGLMPALEQRPQHTDTPTDG